MLTGDASNSGERIAKQLNLDTVHAACNPRDKQAHVETLAAKGAIVAMVGDGVNDSLLPEVPFIYRNGNRR